MKYEHRWLKGRHSRINDEYIFFNTLQVFHCSFVLLLFKRLLFLHFPSYFSEMYLYCDQSGRSSAKQLCSNSQQNLHFILSCVCVCVRWSQEQQPTHPGSENCWRPAASPCVDVDARSLRPSVDVSSGEKNPSGGDVLDSLSLGLERRNLNVMGCKSFKPWWFIFKK